MTRPLLIALALCCLVLFGARGQAPALQQYTNPTAPDSGDSDPSLLGKQLRILTGAKHAAWASVTATTDGTASYFGRVTRRRVGWINTSGETVWISFVSGTTGTVGLTVPAGATGSLAYIGAIYIHSASGNARVDFCEAYDDN